MTIETIYGYNEKVWFLDNNIGKAISGTVYQIKIDVYSHVATIRYLLNASNGPTLPEDKLFPTKEALLQSL